MSTSQGGIHDADARVATTATTNAGTAGGGSAQQPVDDEDDDDQADAGDTSFVPKPDDDAGDGSSTKR